jgi:hypothetical protein
MNLEYPFLNSYVEAERAVIIGRIEDILQRVSDQERDYSDADRTSLMHRLEGYFERLTNLRSPVHTETATKQKELYDKYESLVIGDLEEQKKVVKFMTGFLRRHRYRIRRQQASAGGQQQQQQQQLSVMRL